jgi:hypothetical protein
MAAIRRLARQWMTAAIGLPTALAAAAGDPVLSWNALLLDAIRAETTPPTLASRNLAILHTAIYDAVNSVERTHQPYRFLLPPDGEASAEAAAVGAAHSVLVILHGSVRAHFDAAYEQFVASTAHSAGLTNGLQLGRLIGSLTVSSRSADGASTQIPYIPNDAPGQWRRTPPFFRPPLDPHWRFVEPFCLAELEPFVPPGPPPLESPAYTEKFNQVKSLGGVMSATRTPEQSTIAVFWSDFSYTVTPPGHWQEIAATIARVRGHTLAENARLFALLSLAQADAAIVTWEAKFRYHFWRPVTAIHRADEDGNPSTEKDVAWEAFLLTPSFPEYTSGHSAFSTASATVLAPFFGTDAIAFTVGSDALPGVTRRFDSLSACADEIGMSRIFGGIHFLSANLDGKICGAKIGRQVFENFLLPHDRLPALSVERAGQGVIELRLHGRIGTTSVLEASSDFLTWQPVSTNVAVIGGVVVTNEVTGDVSARFFRLRER